MYSEKRKEYQHQYWLKVKADRKLYALKRLRNQEWNRSEEGRAYKRAYMRQWYLKHKKGKRKKCQG